ncbi:MAG: DNA polymerase IV [Candidatus Bipolaricaulota bacterium]|nr:DNA polymerase IV [Candidatus Bipolaricaulota bacterium]
MNEGINHQPAEQRRIAHLDMDAFFAAVEQLDEPRYRGKAVIVGGLGPRGVVSTASYEARKFGVGSAMPMARARKLCPQGIFLPPRFPRYREIAQQVRDILHEYTEAVEVVSIDEAFFDLTGSGDAEEIVPIVKARAKQETGLTCSVGLAPNRFLAKLASELRKPNGLVIIDPGNVQQIIDPLPVRMIWGVGEVTERRLRSLGILLISDLRQAPLSLLTHEFGAMGRVLHRLACGEDATPLILERQASSVSRETTLAQDIYSIARIEQLVRYLARVVASQLREDGLVGKTVRIKVRFPDFETITRQASLNVGTDSARIVEGMAIDLLRRRVDLAGRGVRLIGVGVGRLNRASTRQLTLFPEDEVIPDNISSDEVPRCLNRQDGHRSLAGGKDQIAGLGEDL